LPVFQPQSGGPDLPLTQTGEVFFQADGVDPNLLLFGFGVLALLGVVALLGYFAYTKRKK